MWTVATRKCHDIREDRKWGLGLCHRWDRGDRSFYNYDKDLIMCVGPGIRLAAITSFSALLSRLTRNPSHWQHTHHISYSEYFSRVLGPPEMKTWPLILTTPVFTIKYCHKSAGNIILGISNDNYRLNVRNKWVVTPPRLNRASWCPGARVTRESQCQRYLTLACISQS